MQQGLSKGFLKVIIIGDSGVGKTSLLEAFNYKKISKSAKPTIGAEFTKRKVVFEDITDVPDGALKLNDIPREINSQ